MERETGRPRAARRFFKAHGLGNDYLVFGAGDDWLMTPPAVRAVCGRRTGVGGDGIVFRLPPLGATERLRMFNPDGSEFERSGNGLRVFAAFLAAAGEVGLGQDVDVEVGGGRVRLRVLGREPDGALDVEAEMGRASFEPSSVGLEPEGSGAGAGLADPSGEPLDAVPVSMGNPHCVVFGRDVSLEELGRLGPHLSAHPAFAGGANVQLAEVEGGRALRALAWERGVGRTRSSGTSACAVAAAAVRRGLVPPGPLEVRMEGGTFRVDVSGTFEITLRGPVREVCRGELADGFPGREAGTPPGSRS